jgi:hypothetical protein
MPSSLHVEPGDPCAHRSLPPPLSPSAQGARGAAAALTACWGGAGRAGGQRRPAGRPGPTDAKAGAPGTRLHRCSRDLNFRAGARGRGVWVATSALCACTALARRAENTGSLRRRHRIGRANNMRDAVLSWSNEEGRRFRRASTEGESARTGAHATHTMGERNGGRGEGGERGRHTGTAQGQWREPLRRTPPGTACRQDA